MASADFSAKYRINCDNILWWEALTGGSDGIVVVLISGNVIMADTLWFNAHLKIWLKINRRAWKKNKKQLESVESVLWMSELELS